MRNIILTLCLVMLLCSCFAGPHQLSRSVDDLDHELYVKNPLLDGVLWCPVPAFPFAHALAFLADGLVINAYHFWFKDVWDGNGAGFKHKPVEPTDGYLESLKIEGAKALELKK